RGCAGYYPDAVNITELYGSLCHTLGPRLVRLGRHPNATPPVVLIVRLFDGTGQ
ncbi:hypothetical protein NEUTE1DRAFT_40163, partial [Neurospora tetrasperma FGSC 2508]